MNELTPQQAEAITEAIELLREVRTGEDFECDCERGALKLYAQFRGKLEDKWCYETDYKDELEELKNNG